MGSSLKLVVTILSLMILLNCGGKKQQSRNSPIASQAVSEADAGVQLNGNQDYSKLSQDELAKLSLAELELILEERKNQNVAEQDELELLDGLNTTLCLELEKLRTQCKMAVRLIPDGNERQLRCNGDYAQVKIVDHKFDVSLPSNISGQYYFIVNDTYQSSSFGGGRTTVAFRAVGSAATLAPQFKQIYRMIVRPVKKGETIPSPKEFNLQFYIDDVSVIKTSLLPSDDRATKDTTLRVNLVEIQQTAKSASCMVSDAQIQALKTSVTTTIKQTQAQKRKQNYIKDMNAKE